MKQLIIASTSTTYGSDYLEYILPDLAPFFKDVREILFVPYARPGGISHTDYTEMAKQTFTKIGKEIRGIHEFDDTTEVVQNARAIFIGGGNTFLLVESLHQKGLIPVIAEAVENGLLYFGTSAGSNITGINMKTTNDMPIIYPQSFKTLGLIPFNINPHYLDPDIRSKHKGETRETRIKEFHVFNSTPVVGLREGSWLEVKGQEIILKGDLTARLFRKNLAPLEINPGLVDISS